MIGSGFMDDLDIDLCGGFFDQIDDLLDFPIEDVEGGGGGECDGFQGAWLPPPPTDAFTGSITTTFPGKNRDNATAFPCKNGDNTTVELPTELSVPHEDIAQLEWLSNFVEDSFSAGSITMENESCGNINIINNNNNSNIKKVEKDLNKDSNHHHQFQTSSPVSVLESSSSCSGGSGSSSGGYRTMPLSPETFVPGRARSKRPRPATFNPRPLISIVSPTTSSLIDPYPESASELDNYADSHPVKKIHFKYLVATDAQQQQQKKKKKKKKLPPHPFHPSSATDHHFPHQQTAGVRKCLHCEITKTPQWRAGPLGPKTLCNACGVRYKSGRLFPEYRPAASPTFVASLHSNSHKKVVEMRTKQTVENSPLISTPELIPNDNSLLHYI
ncbi:GATA transcription factor 8-like [Telopea speciosissima]|uniref:GATA transcription factor 8-like n=1 Tax=Telopea speciosissima TaxID=54955 RepID=UPI001CC44F60|nr:GATA transcription factor 8-like [Telopea speciosissima]XP_043702630.1 GATA transcription factor 8-like [Telopea speciosissima]